MGLDEFAASAALAQDLWARRHPETRTVVRLCLLAAGTQELQRAIASMASLLQLAVALARETEDIGGLVPAETLVGLVGRSHPLSLLAAIDTSIILSAHARYGLSEAVIRRSLAGLGQVPGDAEERGRAEQQLRLGLSGTFLRWGRKDQRYLRQAQEQAVSSLDLCVSLGLGPGYLAACLRRMAEIEIAGARIRAGAPAKARRWLKEGWNALPIHDLSMGWRLQWHLADLEVSLLEGDSSRFSSELDAAARCWERDPTIPNLGRKLRHLAAQGRASGFVTDVNVIAPHPETGWSPGFETHIRGPRPPGTREGPPHPFDERRREPTRPR